MKQVGVGLLILCRLATPAVAQPAGLDQLFGQILNGMVNGNRPPPGAYPPPAPRQYRPPQGQYPNGYPPDYQQPGYQRAGSPQGQYPNGYPQRATPRQEQFIED